MNNCPELRFGKNGAFKLMQISDIQDSGGICQRTRNLLGTVLDLERPDFVVFTGDQIKGYSFSLLLGNKEKKNACIHKTMRELMDLLEERGIPFTILFGNHDHDAPMPAEEQLRYYQQSSLCYAEESPEGVPGCANHVLPIYPANGGNIPALLLYCLDSHSGMGMGYEPLEPEQVDWYRENRDAWAAKNGGQPVPSMLFQHIPVEEINELYRAVPKGTKGALEGYRNYSGKYFVLDDKVAEGFMGELPSSPDTNAGLFDAVREKGEMMGMFFGHDHKNGFQGSVRGVQLGYAPSAGYNAYGPGRLRGVRMFTFRENDLRNYSTKVLTDEEHLGDAPLPLSLRFYDRTPSSFGEAKNKLRHALLPAALVLLGIAGAAVALRLLLGA